MWKKLTKYIVDTHFYLLFYQIVGGISCLFVVGFFLPMIFIFAKWLLLIFLLFVVADLLLLYSSKGISLARKLPEKWSNGDFNQVKIDITNHYSFKVNANIIDEIPPEFQERDFSIPISLEKFQKNETHYQLRPTFRGMIHFGNTFAYVHSPLKLVVRRFSISNASQVPVYPSFIQMRQFDLSSFSSNLSKAGMKKVRRLGHTMEFEKIKEYVMGDDFRTVNWKATAKSQKLMVNQFQDEKSQAVYCIVDKGRVMKMPFDGLSLLDYAINASLAVSNVVLRKQDYAGFLSFSKKVENRVVAERRSTQLRVIMESLFNVKTDFFESDFGRLYVEIKKHITHRSLLLLFTNFETMDGLNRQLPYLKAISRSHVLVVVFFRNTEIDDMIARPALTHQEIFDKVVAEKFAYEKKLIVQELKNFGIHCVLTKPESLTLDTINKYLEIKARGLI